MNFLQKLGKSFYLPIVCLPVCGLLMGVGYFMCPAGMQSGEIIGLTARIGYLLLKAGSAVIDNMALLFAIGVGIGLSDDDAVGGVAALISWFMITTLLNTGNISRIVPFFAENDFFLSAFDKIQNPFMGILSGIIGAKTFMRFKNTRLPAWLGFFSGKRLTVILSGVFSIIAAIILAVVWPMLFAGLVLLGRQIVKMGSFGCALYAMLNRLLIPFGLHHALNSVILFDTIGIGDLTAFWAGKTSADVSWSLGMYMSGFFAPTMIGIPGAALAIYFCADKDRRKKTAGIIFSSALTAFVCGVTEPFEFSFMIACPWLYIVYSALYGIFAYISCVTGFRAGFSFSAGLTDLIFSSALPAAQKTWLFIPLGLAAFAVFFFVFRFMIRKFDFKTIGREEETTTAAASIAANSCGSSMAAELLRALGGAENIKSLTYCATRLRMALNDTAACDDSAIKAAGAAGVIHLRNNGVQVIIGTTVQFVAEEMKNLMQTGNPAAEKKSADVKNVIHGTTASRGIAVAPLFVCTEKPEITEKHTADTAKELIRLEKALSAVRSRLENAKTAADGTAADILDAQLLMLEDSELISMLRDAVGKGMNAEYAAVHTGEERAAVLETMDNEYLRARAADVRDVCEKVAYELIGYHFSAAPDTPSVIVLNSLSPEELAGMNRENVAGIVTADGSVNSHTAILAGNYGIPYIIGADISACAAYGGAASVIDADSGILILPASADEQRKYLEKKKAAEAELERASAYKGETKLYANIASPTDMKDALANRAEGIGLFRTEFLFMNRASLPDEEEQFAAYKSVVEGMYGGEVVIRTIDIGADKKTDCIPLPDEENPALGMRAIRLCLADTGLFRTQLRALLRAAVYGNEKILYPMISSAAEVEEIKKQVAIAADELRERGVEYRIPPQGIMIETPAAALMSDKLAEMSDFFSIGTNDLLQYTTAIDRQGKGLERFYNAHHEALFRLIEMTVKNAHEKGIPVCVCGELGGDTDAIAHLAEIGLDELSMSPFKLPAARAALSRHEGAAESADMSPEEFGAPADGELIPQEEIPDEAFSSGALGKCVGIIPANGNIYSPCDGVITMLPDTLHALGIRSDKGSNVLLHVGIDTVSLAGKGFDVRAGIGQRVKKGELVMTADLDVIRAAGLDTTVIMALTV